MNEQCEAARRELRSAEAGVERAETEADAADAALSRAEGEHREAQYDYERFVEGAKGKDQVVGQRRAALDAAAAELATHEADYSGSNRDALLKHHAEVVFRARADLGEAESDAESAWSAATRQASVAEAKLTAVTSARTHLEWVRSGLADARADAAAAQQAVDAACD